MCELTARSGSRGLIPEEQVGIIKLYIDGYPRQNGQSRRVWQSYRESGLVTESGWWVPGGGGGEAAVPSGTWLSTSRQGSKDM